VKNVSKCQLGKVTSGGHGTQRNLSNGTPFTRQVAQESAGRH